MLLPAFVKAYTKAHPVPSPLSIPTLRVGRAECSRSGCSSSFSLQDVILSTRGLYLLWLRITVISAHVEVLRKERSGWSKTAAGGIY